MLNLNPYESEDIQSSLQKGESHHTLQQWKRVVEIKKGHRHSHLYAKIIDDWDFHTLLLEKEIRVLKDTLFKIYRIN